MTNQNKGNQMSVAGSDYVKAQRREYSLYTLQSRAIPHAADGLKAAARRVLWTARNGHHFKSASLAGATMPLHPHAAPETAINTLAAPYGNNIPLFASDCAFGTLLKPTAYGASRYTSVSLAEFTKDVVFRDIEVIPMIENYDGTLMEPKHFLPLVPMVFVNPQEGIAVGFASNILARDPATIVKHQIAWLESGKKIPNAPPAMLPLDQVSTGLTEDRLGVPKWEFRGAFTKDNATTITITNLPYGLQHEKFVDRLIKMVEEDKIQEYEDNSKDFYQITVRFKKGELSKMSEDEVLSYLGLIILVGENVNVIDFTGERVWETSYVEFVSAFTDWRLKWYVDRYQRLADLLAVDIQRYKDILLAIKKDLGGVARKVSSRSELKEFCETIGIVHLDYIVDLPVYRFTEEEKKKVEAKLEEAETLMKEYRALLKSEDKRREVYVRELREVHHKLTKGLYK
jgi:DNA gyrase/topoisomerase IV subunit A